MERDPDPHRLGSLGNRLAVQLFKHVPWVTQQWVRRHRFVEPTAVPWARLRMPLQQAVVALVTTAGVHLRSQPPFDMDDADGDASFRELPAEVGRSALAITHKYYDHSAADRDINVVLPLDRMRELVARRRVGGLADRCYSFMGHIDGRRLAELVGDTAPGVARRLRADGVDAAFLTPA